MRETSKVRPCQMEATTTAPGSGLVDGLTSSLCQGYVCVYIYIYLFRNIMTGSYTYVL